MRRRRRGGSGRRHRDLDARGRDPSEPPAISMIVDRPFLMAIRDAKTKQISFVGTIWRPDK